MKSRLVKNRQEPEMAAKSTLNYLKRYDEQVRITGRKPATGKPESGNISKAGIETCA